MQTVAIFDFAPLDSGFAAYSSSASRRYRWAPHTFRLIHLRNWAYSWRLHEDLTRHNTFRLEMSVALWNEHLLQKERMTKAEKELLERTWCFHMGPAPPEERIYLSLNRELLRPRQCDCQRSAVNDIVPR